MANLSSLLLNRVPATVLAEVQTEIVEENLTNGKVWAYTPGDISGPFSRAVCWISPGTGTATIEIWGAGGSGSGGCCCFGGIPGNPGAYSKRTITVAANDYVAGTMGFSCGGSNICFRGCSEATCITICKLGISCICMCAEGGAGGVSYCDPSSSIYCCFAAGGFPSTPFVNGCGQICNNRRQALAYGGDVNCGSCMSCMSFWCCVPDADFSNIVHIAYPAGIFSTNGGWLTYNDGECYSQQFNSITPYSQALASMNGKSMGYTQGAMMHCWTGNNQCACYEYASWVPHAPYGFPGMTVGIAGGIRSWGQRGGHGALRITFVGS